MNERWRKPLIATGIVVVIAFQMPSKATVERQALIDAYPATVFTLLTNFRLVDQWAPYTAEDPNARLSFSGPARGVDATIRWDGQIIGQGGERIVASDAFERVAVEVFRGERTVGSRTITLARENGMTRIAWTSRRHYGLNIPGRLLGLWSNSIYGPTLEAQLTSLAEQAEALPRADFSDLELEQLEVKAAPIAFLSATSASEPGAMTDALADAYYEVLGFIDRYDLSESGAPLSVMRSLADGSLAFDAGIPVGGLTERVPRNGPVVRIRETYAGAVVRARHVGTYKKLGETHKKLAAYLAATGIRRNGDAWESYVSDPARTDESGLITYVYYPVRNSGS